MNNLILSLFVRIFMREGKLISKRDFIFPIKRIQLLDSNQYCQHFNSMGYIYKHIYISIHRNKYEFESE